MSGSDPQLRQDAPPAPDQLDLSALWRTALVLSAETPEDPADKTHRHSQETADAELRRWKDKIRFVLSIGFLGTISGVALYILFDHKASPDDKGWARTVLAGVATGLVGYFIGKRDSE